MSFQIMKRSNIIVPTLVTATSSASGFPISRVADTLPPYVRGWRSTSTATQTLSFTFSGSLPIVGCCVYDTNFTSVTVAGVPRTIAKDPWDNRYKLWVPLSTTASSQTVTVPTQSTTDGASYFQAGKIHFMTALLSLTLDPRPDMRMALVSPQLVTQGSTESVYESTPAGPAFIREEWEVFGSHASVADIFTVNEFGMHEPFFLYHNLGNDYETYYMQRISETAVTRGHSAKTIGVSLRQIP